ncbi:MAG: hypothetical protein JHD02_00270 [Thermoleophilaceae bacterium]|nr:hypothetical protein [Thermoleophilaceae bacterium]
MSTLTENPNLDERTRAAIAEIEEDTDRVIASGDVAAGASHLASIVAWQQSVESAIVVNDNELADLADAPADDSLVIAFRGLERCFQASLQAATTLRKRMEDHLNTVSLH